MKNLIKRVITWLLAPAFAAPAAPADRVAQTLRGIEVQANKRGTSAL